MVNPKGRLQGYNAQAAASVDQIIVAAEITNIPNDQVSFVPLAQAAREELAAAGHLAGPGCFLADAGYWSAANASTEVGAEVLIATRESAWRSAPKPDDDRLAVLAKVNAGELSQRAAGDILGVSYTWVRDMTKRYFSDTGQRLSSKRDPDPKEWLPVIERLDRGEISKRAAADQLGISATRVNSMLAHIRGEAIEPSVARRPPWTPSSPRSTTPNVFAGEKSSSSLFLATSRQTAAIQGFPAEASPPFGVNGASSAPPTTFSSCERPSPVDRRPRRARFSSERNRFVRQPQVDLVGHDGGNLAGQYCQTLTLTDVATGWTEPRVLQNKARRWVTEAIDDIRCVLPFSLLGLDSDYADLRVMPTFWLIARPAGWTVRNCRHNPRPLAHPSSVQPRGGDGHGKTQDQGQHGRHYGATGAVRRDVQGEVGGMRVHGAFDSQRDEGRGALESLARTGVSGRGRYEPRSDRAVHPGSTRSRAMSFGRSVHWEVWSRYSRRRALSLSASSRRPPRPPTHCSHRSTPTC